MSCPFAVLTNPTENFWNYFITPETNPPRHAKIFDIVTRTLAFLGAVVTFPLYLAGKCLKFLSPYLLRDPAASALVPSALANPQTLGFASAGLAAEVAKEESALALLEKLHKEPTWANYQQLPHDQQYFVAAKYCGVTPSVTIPQEGEKMQQFAAEFKSEPSSEKAKTAISEAINHQKKVVFTKRLKETLAKTENRKQNLTALHKEDPVTYKQALHFIAKAHDLTEEAPDLSRVLFETNPMDTESTLSGLDRLLSHLRGGYAIEALLAQGA
ncbi:MAG: hypothetical protein JSR76_04560 [Verrucomicrobia bacterium]|nr:hypothetical protein [Verrucomicrobiota bacterium]